MTEWLKSALADLVKIAGGTAIYVALSIAVAYHPAVEASEDNDDYFDRRYNDEGYIGKDTRDKAVFPPDDPKNRDYSLKRSGEVEYPARIRYENIQGYVALQFDINHSGETENITVLEAHPEDVFDRYAIEAIQQSEYYPRMVGGSPVRVIGVRTIVKFCLDTNKYKGRTRAAFCDDTDLSEAINKRHPSTGK